jgi:hypothetical protein
MEHLLGLWKKSSGTGIQKRNSKSKETRVAVLAIQIWLVITCITAIYALTEWYERMTTKIWKKEKEPIIIDATYKEIKDEQKR